MQLAHFKGIYVNDNEKLFYCVTLLWHYTEIAHSIPLFFQYIDVWILSTIEAPPPPPHTHRKHEFSANAYTHPLKRFHCIVIYKCGLSTKSHVVIILHFLFPFACWDHKAWTESLSSHSVKIRRHLVQSLGSKKWSELFFFCRVTGKPHTQCLLALSLYYIMAPLFVSVRSPQLVSQVPFIQKRSETHRVNTATIKKC